MSSETKQTAADASGRRWYRRIGPGLITACVVIGPGSILTSSNAGATHGFAMSWVIVAAVIFMLAYTTLGAKLGVVASESPGDLVTRRAGRWLAALIGVGVFVISATFQFGNNLGVDSAFRTYVPYDYTIVIFNILSISFVFGFKNLYRAVERLMMTLVALMLISFAVNLAFAQYQNPSLDEFLLGFIPGVRGAPDLNLLGLVGTTFVITAAFFQAYLVRQKGWGKAELRDGLVDARVGSIVMALITLMIMCTAATVLRGHELAGVGDVAVQLKPAFGESGQLLFCVGLFCAAYSSFLVNSMIGGFILSDGLGLGSKPTDVWPRVFTVIVLLTGMVVALYVIKSGTKPVGAIVAAQAVTVVAAPLMAGALLWLTNLKSVMGEDRNGLGLNLLASIGAVLLALMAWYTAVHKVWPAVSQWIGLQ